MTDTIADESAEDTPEALRRKAQEFLRKSDLVGDTQAAEELRRRAALYAQRAAELAANAETADAQDAPNTHRTD